MRIISSLMSGFAGVFCVVLLLGLLHLQVDAAFPQNSQQTAVDNALDYLLTQQITQTGGYGSGSLTAESTLSIGSSELNAADWKGDPNGRSIMDYWLVNGKDYTIVSAGESGKLALGLVAADGCWPPFALQPSEYYSPTTGKYHQGSINQAFGMLGDAALDRAVPPMAVTYLKSKIQPDGAWEYGDLYGTDTNTTALAVQALLASGETAASTEVISGLNYLESSQNSDGGFPYSPDATWPGGTDSDTNSTAYVVQAILAAGEDPTSGRWVISSTNPISYLLKMQLADGSFEFQTGGGSNLLATQQAIPALNLKFYPFKTGDFNICPVTFLPTVFR